MPQKMVIDATRPGEARVVVLKGERVEEFDYETATKTQVKGNIYLAKVTRVEPSLQAAFVDFGGNRHGFLPFSEIHSDYYRLPVADREQLLAVEAGHHVEGEGDEAAASEDGEDDTPESAMDRALDQEVPEEPEGKAEKNGTNGTGAKEGKAANGHDEDDGEDGDESAIDTLDGDEIDDVARRRAQFLRKYKIQEVIKRRQVMLVQVTKEERGTKGAALTTYLSLAGRYCVLMPNTATGGGISRKISNAADRKRLKTVMSELDIPSGMAVIVRTAGSQRTRTEISHDYEYLLRLWDEVRNKTLESTAPSLIHEEANLIKRAIRDVYARDMESIEVEGEEGYRTARAVMRTLIPSHARKIRHYKEAVLPLFQKYRVEEQLEAMHSHTVRLRSGGSIVLNPTEALVAIDVNSGRSTSERHIEETAFKTNLEAADEVARQLRLRDLAGLIVIDFIDMEDARHNREVEKRLKEATKQDRARIQLGQISGFGLLELSRQRLRPSLFETVNITCSTCRGLGYLRSPDSLSLTWLDEVTQEAVQRGSGRLEVHAPVELALYLLNEKRESLRDLERRFDIMLFVRADDSLGAQEFLLRRLSREGQVEERRVDAQKDSPAPATAGNGQAAQQEERRASNRARGRNGRGRGANGQEQRQSEASAASAEQQAERSEAAADESAPTASGSGNGRAESEPRRSSRPRRRGRRGGRRRSGRRDSNGAAAPEQRQEAAAQAGEEASGREQPKAAEATRGRSRDEEAAGGATAQAASGAAAEAAPEVEAAPARRARSRRRLPPSSPPENQRMPDEVTKAEAGTASEDAEAGAQEAVASAQSASLPEQAAPEAPASKEAAPEVTAAATKADEASEPQDRSEKSAADRKEHPAAESAPAQREQEHEVREAQHVPEPEGAPEPESTQESQGAQEAEGTQQSDSAREPETVGEEAARPLRRGWWSRD